jgi:ABC-type polysaccharide/polyol phosphate export permease
MSDPSVSLPRTEHVSGEDHVGFVATWTEMVSELYVARELLWQMTLRDLRLRYKQAVMGFAWALLMPLLVVGAGLMVKYVLAQMAGQPLESGSFAGMAVKALPWSFFIGSITFATSSLTSNLDLVTKIYFPREVFPLSAVLTQLVDSAVGSLVVAVIVFGLLGVSLHLAALWIIPLGILLVLLTSAACLLLSCGNLFFRDVKYIVQVLLTFGIFFTPVLFDIEQFGPTGSFIMMLNPISPLLEGLRLSVVDGHNLLAVIPLGDGVYWHPAYLLYAAVWSIGGLAFAWWLFHRLEFVYAEYI